MTEEELSEDTTFDTDIVVDGETVETIETPVYTFSISEQTIQKYGVTYQVLSWLQENMESLKDDYDNQIFGKVNTGFDDKTLKTFGKRPVCDVYINNVEYDSYFDTYIPIKVNTIVLFYMKGANNPTYMKGCELHDFIMQEFITQESFKRLGDVVKDTVITNSEVRNENIRGGYGVMGIFELTHDLYY